ncbi:solute carrier family 35 member G1-like [Petromyzon marinus]|uniref:solute carrier family 35 member G1-like n=1 Tax=Petromyzon marinus TaxID=7757 RepID=UPI003F6E9644
MSWVPVVTARLGASPRSRRDSGRGVCPAGPHVTMSARFESRSLKLRKLRETKPLLVEQEEEEVDEDWEEVEEQAVGGRGAAGRGCGSCCGRKDEGTRRRETEDREKSTRGGHGTTFRGAGIILALVSSLAVTVNSVLVKRIDSVPPLEIAFIRFFFQAAVILPLLILYREPLLLPLPPPGGKRLSMSLLLLLRGLLGAAGNICVVVAVRSLPLSDATVITFSRAALTGGIARGVLGEPCSPWDPPLAALAFAGVTLAARPPLLFGGGDDDDGDGPTVTLRLLGSLAALLSALCSAGAFVCLRLLGASASLLTSTWAISLAGMAQSLLLLLLVPPTLPSLPCLLPCDPPWARAALVLTGPVAALGQLSLARALQLEGAGLVAAIRTCDVLLAVGAQAVMLDEGLPGPLSFVGAACVALSAAGAALVKKKGPREAERRSAGPEGSEAESDRERLLADSPSSLTPAASASCGRHQPQARPPPQVDIALRPPCSKSYSELLLLLVLNTQMS